VTRPGAGAGPDPSYQQLPPDAGLSPPSSSGRAPGIPALALRSIPMSKYTSLPQTGLSADRDATDVADCRAAPAPAMPLARPAQRGAPDPHHALASLRVEVRSLAGAGRSAARCPRTAVRAAILAARPPGRPSAGAPGTTIRPPTGAGDGEQACPPSARQAARAAGSAPPRGRFPRPGRDYAQGES
jgi:hypothetical protein